MQLDEAQHGAAAQEAGARELPRPVRWAMRLVSRVMTQTAHHV
jgi:3-demethoxyubiquinol 3-hydroxylase